MSRMYILGMLLTRSLKAQIVRARSLLLRNRTWSRPSANRLLIEAVLGIEFIRCLASGRVTPQQVRFGHRAFIPGDASLRENEKFPRRIPK